MLFLVVRDEYGVPVPAGVLRKFPGDGERMRRGFIGGGKDRPRFVRIPVAIVNVEIKPPAFRCDHRSGLAVGCDVRNQALDVVPGCPLQRAGDEIYKRIELVRKAATDLLVNNEDNAMIVRFAEPRPENIANAACQYKIVVPLALA